MVWVAREREKPAIVQFSIACMPWFSERRAMWASPEYAHAGQSIGKRIYNVKINAPVTAAISTVYILREHSRLITWDMTGRLSAHKKFCQAQTMIPYNIAPPRLHRWSNYGIRHNFQRCITIILSAMRDYKHRWVGFIMSLMRGEGLTLVIQKKNCATEAGVAG